MNVMAKSALAAIIASTAIIFAPATKVHAQADNEKLKRAYAAGYKAHSICAGMFSGGKTMKQIERDELTGVYPDIADILSTLTAKVSTEAMTVSVSFAKDMPPRIAVHNYLTGCTSLPIGSIVERPSRIRGTRLSPGSMDAEGWPVGDMNVRRDGPAGSNAYDRIGLRAINNGEFGGKTSAFLVVKNGQLVSENYMPGHDKHTGQRSWSIAKSITATYAGYVRQKTNSDFGEDADMDASPDPRRDIGIDTLLRMASGMHSDTIGWRTDHIDMGGGHVREWATPFPLLHKPGTVFRYANNDTMIAMLKMRAEAPQLHPHNMFDQIGMTRTFAATDPLGDYISSSLMWTTARDIARLGQLYLNNGLWPDTGPDANRILPSDWRKYVSMPSGPQKTGRNFGYGASFWLMDKTDGIPKDTFAAFGNRGQYLVIIPSENILIIRFGYDSQEAPFDIEAASIAVLATSR